MTRTTYTHCNSASGQSCCTHARSSGTETDGKQCSGLSSTAFDYLQLIVLHTNMGPYLKKDINALVQIQHRATKMITSLRKLPYEQRLKECNLTTLEERRKRGDLLEPHKIMHGLERIPEVTFFARGSAKGAGTLWRFTRRKIETGATQELLFTTCRDVSHSLECTAWKGSL